MAKVMVWVKPGKKKESVEVLPDETLVVSITARAVEGRANEALRKLLARHFGVATSCVVIEKGKASRKKVVEIVV